MTTERTVSIHSVVPMHPGRGVASYIAAQITLDYIKGTPIVMVPLTTSKATVLIEQLAQAVNIIEGRR